MSLASDCTIRGYVFLWLRNVSVASDANSSILKLAFLLLLEHIYFLFLAFKSMYELFMSFLILVKYNKMIKLNKELFDQSAL